MSMIRLTVEETNLLSISSSMNGSAALMFSVSPRLPSSKDTDRLFSMLPYKTLSFSKIEGRHGTYALIDKNENRGTDIRRVRPSIRAQLAADKRKAAPKKAAVKSKNHELEV